MARVGALPKAFGRIHPRYQSPSFSTLIMGGISILWYVGLTLVSQNVLADSIAALGLMIAFYYGLTGFACAIYFRRELTKSLRNFVYIGALPVIGAVSLTYIFIRSCSDLSKADAGDAGTFLGVGVPLVIGLGGLLLGVVLMIVYSGLRPEFFRRKLEVADPHLLDEPQGG
jgi:amino acid transporter